jgi:hypothetical protein
LTHAFSSQRTFRPTHSLLGRALRRWTGDRLKGEAYYILALTGLVLALLMAHYLGWALLQPVFTGPDGAWYQTVFWLGQLASVAVVAAVGLVGFRPPLTVRCDDAAGRLCLSQGDRSCAVDYDAVGAVSLIPARRFHRHYRHYAATRIFVGRLDDEVLLLETSTGPVVVALPAKALGTLCTHLAAATEAEASTDSEKAPVEARSEAP